jgi:peptidoglycan hydrolase CwlO-like protein
MSQDASVKSVEAISSFTSALNSFSSTVHSDAAAVSAEVQEGRMWMLDYQNRADSYYDEMQDKLQQAERNLKSALNDLDDEEPDYSEVNYWENRVEEITAALTEMREHIDIIHSSFSLVQNYTDQIKSRTETFKFQCSHFADAGVSYLRKAETDIRTYKATSIHN